MSLVDKGHGRLEIRTLESTTVLNDYLDWPGISQVFRLTRVRKIKGTETVEVVYGITSQSRQRADAKTLIGYIRSHWGIENRLHHVRDVTFGEDDCRVRSGSAPQILAEIRNLTIPILRQIHPKNIAAALRHLVAKPHRALRMVVKPGELNSPALFASYVKTCLRASYADVSSVTEGGTKMGLF